jgi:predicted ABC-type ATPase
LTPRGAPDLVELLSQAISEVDRPVAFVVAGHNGSGKSTLWNERLSQVLEIPLINADRLTASILPERDPDTNLLPQWAQDLRDKDERWQRLSQLGVRAFVSLVMDQELPFAMETVFSHWEERPDGSFYSSKIEEIQNMQAAGYFVVLLFVGLASVDLSALRVQTRLLKGGHDVPRERLIQRFPRTQAAIRTAAPIADMTLMFDNSRDLTHAFSLVRAQRGSAVLYDCRDSSFELDEELVAVASAWLPNVSDDLLANGAAVSAQKAGRSPRKHK